MPVLDDVVHLVETLTGPRVLVAVDGSDAAGKTTFARRLVRLALSLEPLHAGSSPLRTRAFDHLTESPSPSTPADVSASAVLVVEGVSLLRPESRSTSRS